MEEVRKLIESNGTQFVPGLEETFRKLYEPFYPGLDNDLVKAVKDIRYGPDERNKLDVYYPAQGRPSETESQKKICKPVLVFVHGGGFVSGDKGWSDKVYGNIGGYFASKGIITVIGNHRLVPNTKYPDGAEDIQLTREWIYHNISANEYGAGNPNKVILCGHSSGAAHIASNIYSAGDPTLPKRDPLFPPVAGLALFSCPFWFDVSKPMRNKVITHYYGSADENVWKPLSPIGLFERVPNDSPVLDSQVLPTMLGTVKYETAEATEGALMFFNSYRARSKPTSSLPLYHVLDNHNHLSNILSIGTEDEEQAKVLHNYILSCARKVDERIANGP